MNKLNNLIYNFWFIKNFFDITLDGCRQWSGQNYFHFENHYYLVLMMC